MAQGPGELHGLIPHEPFNEHVPERGWLRDYVEWTLGSEAPLPFHFFVGAAVLGAALGRNVYFNKGYYRLWPCLQILLIGPTGVVRKTSAINLGIRMLDGLGDINLVRNKTTPEGLVDSLRMGVVDPDRVVLGPPRALAVMAAPELAVMLGKQKYNEGMISMLTELFDCPDKWDYKTKSAGTTALTDVTITMLGASTPDWLITAIPQDAFGGGFMSRLLFVVQETTVRCYPIPEPPPKYDKLLADLKALRSRMHGPITLTHDAMEWYTQWYATSRKRLPEDEKMAGYHERKPDHMLRLGIVLACSEGRAMIQLQDVLRAGRILGFLEYEMLATFKWLGMKPIGQDQEKVMRTLRSAGGSMSHSDLMRKLIYFMNAPQLKNAVTTLLESRMISQSVTGTGLLYSIIDGGDAK